MFEALWNVSQGIFSGLVAAFFGFMKSKDEKFDLRKFVQTLVIGGLVGGVAQVAGMTYDDAYDYLASIGIISLAEYIKKLIWRRWLSKFFSK